MTIKPTSRFAAVLREIFDGPGFLSRDDWAKILFVTPSAISQWLADKTVPRAPTLRTIVRMARRYSPADAQQRFDAVADEPAERVSPVGERMAPTIAHYMVEPIRNGFLELLATLKPKSQEVVLFAAADHCRQLRENDDLDGSGPVTPPEAHALRFPGITARARRPKKQFAEVGT